MVAQIFQKDKPPATIPLSKFIACTPIRVIKINYPRFILQANTLCREGRKSC